MSQSLNGESGSGKSSCAGVGTIELDILSWLFFQPGALLVGREFGRNHRLQE